LDTKRTNQNSERKPFRKGHMMKAIELRLIAELMKNCRRSDRDLAKALGVSQPTVSRTRTSLEKQGLIEYTAIPDFTKLGYELLVFTLTNRDLRKRPYSPEEAKHFMERNPFFVFAAGGMGAGYNRIAVSVYKDFAEYYRVMQEMKTDWAYSLSMNNFIVDLKSGTVVQPLSFKKFAEHLERDVMSMHVTEKNQKRYPTRKAK
jgi:DNA-binding Lrp family transcriptional regulator